MKLRIATFNLENLDFVAEQKPSLEERIRILKPQLQRINADILFLQEIHSQKSDEKRNLEALDQLLKGTKYQNYSRSVTKNQDGDFFNQRNLITLTRFEILETNQYKHKFTPQPEYKSVTSIPQDEAAKKVTWERPILHTKIKVKEDLIIDALNLHLKSKIGTNIPGQKRDDYSWNSASGWAEGYFISSMRRVGQALETRMIVDKFFDQNIDANIVVAGDFNADFDEVPVEAILGRTENTGNEELNDRVLIPCENSIPETSRFSLYHQGRKEMIDHVLISKNLLQYYSHAEIHNETLKDESIAFATDIKFPDSDHAAVVAEFEVRE